jgi:hypothetical protein
MTTLDVTCDIRRSTATAAPVQLGDYRLMLRPRDSPRKNQNRCRPPRRQPRKFFRQDKANFGKLTPVLRPVHCDGAQLSFCLRNGLSQLQSLPE